MKEFIDKLIERLEEKAKHDEQRAIKTDETERISLITSLQAMADRYRDAISIVNELAEEYKVSEMPTGWIPVSERLPEDGVKVMCYGSNALGRMRYEVSCYSHKLRWWKCSVITEVFAWQPLPAPYTEGE